MDGVVELITGRDCRRRWSVEDKFRIVEETRMPDARISGVAARHGICESLIYAWRRQMREGVLVAPEMPVFTPVRMFETPQSAAPAQACLSPLPARPPSGLIEIELGNGRQVRVGSDVNLAALRRVTDGIARVIPIPTGVRIWIATGHTDMRRGMRGLALQVQEGLGRDPFRRRYSAIRARVLVAKLP